MRKTRRKPRRRTRKPFWVILLLAIGAFLVAWWVWPGYYAMSPRFHSVMVQKNDELLLVQNGETLELHPRDRLKILRLSTSVTFNIGVRLFTSGFDVPALSHEKLPVSSLLPKEKLEAEQKYKVVVKYLNQEIGSFDIHIRPFVEDWLDKAERVIDPARKIEVLEEAMKFAPQEKRIRTRLLEEYKAQRKWKEAVELLESDAKEKEDPQVLYDLVQAYEEMNNEGGLLSSLRRIVKIQPQDWRTRLRYASALERSKKTQEAIAQYEEALKRAEKGEQLAIYKDLGYLYSQTGDHSKAAQNYVKAYEMDRGDSNLCYNLSSLYEKIGDDEKADHYLGEAIRLKPEDSEGRMRLAERLVRRGKLEEAERHLADLLRKDPRSMKTLLLMSEVAEKRKDTRKQREIYGRIIALEPENQTVIYNLGILAYEAGDLQASLPHLEKYAKAHPDEGDVHQMLFEIYRKQKKEELAFREAQTLAALHPREYQHHLFILEYLSTRGEYGKVIEAAAAGVQALPENVDIRNYLVLAYLKTGKEDLALAEMQQILKLTPKDLELLFRIARIQEKKGLIPDAVATYRKILNIAPEHEEASEAYLRLRMSDLPREKE